MRILAHVNTKYAPLHGNMNPSTSPALARKSRALSGTCAMPGGDFQLEVPTRYQTTGCGSRGNDLHFSRRDLLSEQIELQVVRRPALCICEEIPDQ